jgi:hypothetical protein
VTIDLADSSPSSPDSTMETVLETPAASTLVNMGNSEQNGKDVASPAPRVVRLTVSSTRADDGSGKRVVGIISSEQEQPTQRKPSQYDNGNYMKVYDNMSYMGASLRRNPVRQKEIEDEPLPKEIDHWFMI